MEKSDNSDKEDVLKGKAIISQEMLLVPAGEFIMGTDEEDEEGKSLEIGMIKPWYIDEHPAHKVYLESFYIDRYEVTNAMYKKFADSSGYMVPASWKKREYPAGMDNHPVVSVTWFAAKNYCAWNGKYLPTEAEWEKAAKGADGRKYPWGNTFDKNKSNSLALVKELPMPVGTYEEGKSPYGVYDMVGNVFEWVNDWYKPYPDSTYKSDDYGEKFRVIRGISYGKYGHFLWQEDNVKMNEMIAEAIATTTYRTYFPPSRTFPDVGFRCAKHG